MDVFVVITEEHYELEILGVFNTWELAEQYIDNLITKRSKQDNVYEIMVLTVMGELPDEG